MTSVTYIVSNINKALYFEWIAAAIDKTKFKISFILLNPGDSILSKHLHENNIEVHSVIYRSKKDIPAAARKVRKIIKQLKCDIVHAHLVDAGLVTSLACIGLKLKRKIYTRHHADYHHIYHPNGVKYDRWINKRFNVIVAISNLVRSILVQKEYVPEGKVRLIEHGFKLDVFENVNALDVAALKEKYKLQNHFPIVGVVSRYIELKGIQYIIPAFAEVLKSYPNAQLVLANTSGAYKKEITSLLSTLPSESYVEIKFENNNAALYKCFDIFLHVPVGPTVEAYGQTYIESMACGIPSVFTKSGIGIDILRDEENCLLVNYKSSEEITKAIFRLLSETDLRNQIINNGRKAVQDRFALPLMMKKLESLYLE